MDGSRWGLFPFAAIALALVLAGCGGGPGSTPLAAPRPNAPPPAPPPPPPPPPSTDPASFRTAEYNRSWGLEGINAAEAYATGYNGSGVIVGILDFNFDFASGEVNFAPASRGRDPTAVALYEAQIGDAAPTEPHGQAVAVAAAGVKNDLGVHGVAFGAQVLAVDFFSRVDERRVFQDGIDYVVSNPWTYLVRGGARVVNKSLGYDEGDVIDNPPPVSQRYVVETDAYVVAEGALLVVSAGNNGDPEPSLSVLDTMDELRASNLLDQGPGALIIAGAVDRTNTITEFSDRAGAAMNYYLVAPGLGIVLPWDGALASVGGTSFSAAFITGAAAVLFQRWPQLTAREVANILFDSATDLGAPGVDAVYGRGLVNLGAALRPVGTSTIAVKGLALGPRVADSALVTGSAFGDAGKLRQGLSAVTMRDGYGRDFQIDLSGGVKASPTRASLAAAMDTLRAWRTSGLSLGGASAFTAAMRIAREDEASLALTGVVPSDRTIAGRDLVMEFSGKTAGFAWVAGAGRGLDSAMASGAGADMFSLRRPFVTGLASEAGAYGVVTLPLSRASSVKWGLARAVNQDFAGDPGTAIAGDAAVYSTALRFDHQGRGQGLALEVGAMVEPRSLLGGRSAGGLLLADGARTAWTRLGGDLTLGDGWSLIASLTAALTKAGESPQSIVRLAGPIVANAFALGLAGADLVRPGDRLVFSLSQPLRVAAARARLVAGAGRDETGAIAFEERTLPLIPSGREIALEAAYTASLGPFLAQANIAYAFAAGHIAGQRDAALIFNLARRF
ncbi:MAG: S8 family serine peptidase [Pseudomonadota bacterium]